VRAQSASVLSLRFGLKAAERAGKSDETAAGTGFCYVALGGVARGQFSSSLDTPGNDFCGANSQTLQELGQCERTAKASRKPPGGIRLAASGSLLDFPRAGDAKLA
jgi:hypothetical protein